jgi:hypothetical protein
MGLLVIFGAGASYDSINPATFITNPNERNIYSPYYRPPLASQLFEDRPNFNDILKLYPYFNGRVPDLRRKVAAGAGGFNVEHELERIKAEAEQYPPAIVELAAMRFYLRRVLWDCGITWHERAAGATNYAELLSRIERWRLPRKERVVLVTFNYDLMLDLAAAAYPVALKVGGMDDYIGRDEYKLIKPHGSVNWGQLVDHHPERSLSDEDVTRLVIERAGELRVADAYTITGLSVSVARDLYFPAIAIPVENKSDFACPRSHLDALVRSLTDWKGRRDQVDDMRHILVIGWRASENQFLELLRGYLEHKRVLVVAQSQVAAEQTAVNLAKAGVERGSVSCSDKAGFSEFLATEELEGFLHAD